MNDSLISIVEQVAGKDVVKLKFLNRLEEGHLTRSENPTSHLCAYFAAYDPATRNVFIGHHKKSGLWLFNGGHMDPGESPAVTVIREAQEEWGITLHQHTISPPQLATLTEIEHPERQTCEWHYDVWHFLPVDERVFVPNPTQLSIEFSEYGWKSYEQAKNLMTDPASQEALAYCKNLK